MNPKRDPSTPLSPTEIGRLQSDRAAAQAWLDAAEVDVVRAKQKLEHAEAERANARAALEEKTTICEREMRLAHCPIAGRGA